MLYQNDPYQGNNHLPDFIMAKPVFFDGRIVAYTAVRGHYVDVGGGGPGSYSATMPDIYAEGLRIPPVRIFKEGVLNQDIVDVLRHNTRNSRERFGDLRSQYAGCVAAERRVISFCEKYGVEALRNGDGRDRRCRRSGLPAPRSRKSLTAPTASKIFAMTTRLPMSRSRSPRA